MSGLEVDSEQPCLTALRRVRPGLVALEVDGSPWRVVPDEVVVKTGLARGALLDRPLLRRFRAELRRAEALRAAGRQVSRGDVAQAAVGGASAESWRQACGRHRRHRYAGASRGRRRRAAARMRVHRSSRSEVGGMQRSSPVFRRRESRARRWRTHSLISTSERIRAARLVADLPVRKAMAVLARRGFDPELVEEWSAGLDVEG